MKQIKIQIVGQKATVDFEGFDGSTCQTEEAKMRLLSAVLGIRSEPDEQEPKRNDAEADLEFNPQAQS